jgi:organic hydroperoxide reductase OsmC/OhrA
VSGTEAQMSEHKATISWDRGGKDFTYEAYSRDHKWSFDGGVEVAGSAAPTYLGNPKRVDPEEALVASAASCHMLTFLALAARKRFVVDGYDDAATGFMEKNENGKLAITRIVLRPKIRFGGSTQPTAEEVDRLHELAHENCFIANSVRTEITVEQ